MTAKKALRLHLETVASLNRKVLHRQNAKAPLAAGGDASFQRVLDLVSTALCLIQSSMMIDSFGLETQ
jgi:hypothetical protein